MWFVANSEQGCSLNKNGRFSLDNQWCQEEDWNPSSPEFGRKRYVRIVSSPLFLGWNSAPLRNDFFSFGVSDTPHLLLPLPFLYVLWCLNFLKHLLSFWISPPMVCFLNNVDGLLRPKQLWFSFCGVPENVRSWKHIHTDIHKPQNVALGAEFYSGR